MVVTVSARERDLLRALEWLTGLVNACGGQVAHRGGAPECQHAVVDHRAGHWQAPEGRMQDVQKFETCGAQRVAAMDLPGKQILHEGRYHRGDRRPCFQTIRAHLHHGRQQVQRGLQLSALLRALVEIARVCDQHDRRRLAGRGDREAINAGNGLRSHCLVFQDLDATEPDVVLPTAQKLHDTFPELTDGFDKLAEKRDEYNNALAEVSRCGFRLQRVPEALKSDKQVVLAANKQDGAAFKSAAEALKFDKQFVSAAVKQHGEAFKFAAEALTMDKQFVLAAVRQNGAALEVAAGALKADKQVVLEAVKQNGRVLQFAAKALNVDKQFVLAAVKQNAAAFEFAAEALQADRQFVLEAVKQNVAGFKFAAEALRLDKRFVLEGVKQNVAAFKFAHLALRTTKPFVLQVVEHNCLALHFDLEDGNWTDEGKPMPIEQYGKHILFFGSELEADKDVVVAAVQNNGLALEFAAEALKTDRQVVLAAVKQNAAAL